MRKQIILILFLIPILSISQQKINLVKEGNYHVIDGLDTISKHNIEYNATESLINYFNKTGSTTVRIKPYAQMRIDFEGSESIHSDKVDTLTVSGKWHITGEFGNYFRLLNGGDIINIETDTIIKWQKDIELVRTKTFGETKYKNTGNIPFQFTGYEITSIDSTQVNFDTFATEKHCIKYSKDGVFYKEFQTDCEPILKERGWKSSYKAFDLEPDTSYKILVEGNTLEGNYNTIEFEIKTL